jgi:glucose dehydrogenase
MAERTIRIVRRSLPLVVAVATAISGPVWADEDWPTYQHDASRSGVSAQKIAMPLAEHWIFQPPYAPVPAWGDPKSRPVEGIQELRRIHFDDVFHVAVAGGRAYFGSSADHKVYCLDATSGRVIWTRITGGPVRLAPTVVDGRVYVGSDDGCAYCLNARDGSILWRFRAAPEDRRVLGHGRMISLWPLRSGILVEDGIAYLAAGIFPAEGVFLFALDAKTGGEIWRNDSCGEAPQSLISPQG